MWAVCNWFGHILYLVKWCKWSRVSVALHSPPQLCHLLSPHGSSNALCNWLSSFRVKGQAFKRELLHWHNKRWQFIWRLTTTSLPLHPALPCILTAPWGALNLFVCWCVCGCIHVLSCACVLMSCWCVYLCPMYLFSWGASVLEGIAT